MFMNILKIFSDQLLSFVQTNEETNPPNKKIKLKVSRKMYVEDLFVILEN